MQIEEIISRLQRNTGDFPREAVLAAVEQREEITPALLEVLEKTVAEPESYAAETDSLLLVYAMFLLAQFREVRAYP